MATLPPDTLLGDRFRIAGVLGQGGMATVYLAQDLRRGEKVALKLLHAHLAADPSARRRLERERAAAGRLDHPGVLLATEAVELDGHVGLVLPLHPGRTLAEAVAMDGPLPPDQVRRVGQRLAEALEAAHRAGVLHRDVTPRNVLLDDRGAPVLTDFGLARLAEQHTGRSTQLVGTTGFLAPEVLQGHRADPRADLYGLGAVLYQATTGQAPFQGGPPAAVLRRQLDGELVPVRELSPDTPAWLAAVIETLLDPDPTRRPAGAAEVVDLFAVGEAPPPPAETAVAVTAALPAGPYTVVVQETEDRKGQRDFRRAVHRRARHSKQRRHGRDHPVGFDLSTVVDDAAEAIEELAGWDDPANTLEGKLTAVVADQAGLPDGALQIHPAVEKQRFHLARGVDQQTAEALAAQVRMLGLRARVYRDDLDGVGVFLRRQWWALIPLMWVAFPGLMMVGAPSWTVFLFTALTVFLATVVGPLVTKDLMSEKEAQAPVAYGADLSALLAEGYASQVAGEAEAPEQLSRAQAAAVEAGRAVDGLAEAVAAREETLPVPVAQDLRGSVAELRREVAALSEDTARMEAELSAAAGGGSGSGGDDGWVRERLARLQTLARAGQGVDEAEVARLEATVAAQEAAAGTEAALDSRLTADVARMLEIAATARRLARQLALDHAGSAKPEAALADLERRAKAAAAARAELLG